MFNKTVEWYKVSDSLPEFESTIIVYRESSTEPDSELEFAFVSYFEDWDNDGKNAFVDINTDEEIDFVPEVWAYLEFLPQKGIDY